MKRISILYKDPCLQTVCLGYKDMGLGFWGSRKEKDRVTRNTYLDLRNAMKDGKESIDLKCAFVSLKDIHHVWMY